MGAKRRRIEAAREGQGGVGSRAGGSDNQRTGLPVRRPPHADRTVETTVARRCDGAVLLAATSARKVENQDALIAELYEQIGRLQMEVEWLKKKLPGSIEVKRGWIDPDMPRLSIRRQCELLALNRRVGTTGRRASRRRTCADAADRRAVPEDAVFRQPQDGVELGISRGRVQRLMRLMGLEAIYPKPRLSQNAPASNLPVFAAESGDHATQPGVVQRHHVRAHAARLLVPDGGDGLVQPLRAGVAIVEHVGRAFCLEAFE